MKPLGIVLAVLASFVAVVEAQEVITGHAYLSGVRGTGVATTFDKDGRAYLTFTYDPATHQIAYTVTVYDIAMPYRVGFDFTPTSGFPRIFRSIADNQTESMIAGVVTLSGDIDLETILSSAIIDSADMSPALVGNVVLSAPVGARVIPVVGRAPGANKTFFVTDLRLSNHFAIPAEVVLDYYASGGSSADPTISAKVVVGERSELVLDDLMKNVFGVESGVGALVIRSDVAIVAAARVYNDQRAVGAGTFSQYVPSRPLLLSERSVTGVLSLISNEDVSVKNGYRTNVGWYNPTGETLDLRFDAYDEEGTRFAFKVLQIPPYQHSQQALASLMPDTANTSGFNLLITHTESLQVYASVVDNTNGDGIFINPERN